MNDDKYKYDFSVLTNPNAYGNRSESDQSQETDDKMTKIEDLFDELDDTYSDSSSAVMSHDIDDVVSPVTMPKITEYDSKQAVSMPKVQVESPVPAIMPKVDELEKTGEIDSVQLENLLNARNEISKLIPNKENNDTSNTDALVSQSKGVTKAKQKSLHLPGFKNMEFSNGDLTKTFLDCVVLCGITATIGGSMLMYIVNHI